MDGLVLTFGIILGLLFCALMVFKILPPLDHIVKKKRGPVEACLCTRFCPLVIGLPFYVFTIWMTLVILVKPNSGISVLNEICGNDYGCSNSFALGRTNFDKDACVEVGCSDSELQERSGAQPSGFSGLGLGDELSPSVSQITFTCLEESNGTCIVASAGDESCSCVGEPNVDSAPLDCSSVAGCLGDIEGNTWETTCTNNECTEWSVSTDSDKQFSFLSCECEGDDCATFTCETFVMLYFYPNIFYAGCATILFVLPTMLVIWVLLRTRLIQLLPCRGPTIITYSQEAGVTGEYTGEQMVDGFAEEQVEKQKVRSIGFKDVFGFFAGLGVIVFFSVLIVKVSGRVGMAFIVLSAALILIYDFVRLIFSMRKICSKTKERVDKNNPDPNRGEF